MRAGSSSATSFSGSGSEEDSEDSGSSSGSDDGCGSSGSDTSSSPPAAIKVAAAALETAVDVAASAAGRAALLGAGAAAALHRLLEQWLLPAICDTRAASSRLKQAASGSRKEPPGKRPCHSRDGAAAPAAVSAAAGDAPAAASDVQELPTMAHSLRRPRALRLAGQAATLLAELLLCEAAGPELGGLARDAGMRDEADCEALVAGLVQVSVPCSLFRHHIKWHSPLYVVWLLKFTAEVAGIW
jgi:hypothetical protein